MPTSTPENLHPEPLSTHRNHAAAASTAVESSPASLPAAPASLSSPSYEHAYRASDSAQQTDPIPRTNSVGSLRDGVGNNNRWSQSTNSSKPSPPRLRSNGSKRRMSLVGLHNTSPASGLGAGRSPSRQTSSLRPIDTTVYSSSLLPPIASLPSLQQAVDDAPTPLTAAPTPSTATLLNAAVTSGVPDYFGKSWTDTSTSNETQSNILSQKSQKAPESTTTTNPESSPIDRVGGRLSPRTRRPEAGDAIDSKGHSRNRSNVGKSSDGTASSSRSGKRRGSKQPSQKTMLSKALQKANTAVLLDSAQNFEGAVQAYSEACALLQQVMQRSSGDEDRQKLEAIRNTYSSRISELEKLAPEPQDEGKALPARPPTSDSSRGFGFEERPMSRDSEYDERIYIGTASVTRIVDEEVYEAEKARKNSADNHRTSLLPSPFDPVTYRSQPGCTFQYQPQVSSKFAAHETVTESTPNGSHHDHLPQPLSSRRPSPPTNGYSARPSEKNQTLRPSIAAGAGHNRAPSNESMSWLDTIEESSSSAASSVHARTSSMGVRRKHIRSASGETEAEFDAALDAAVEAAYDDGYEPAAPSRDEMDGDELIANVRRRVEVAKERVRQTERETAIELAREREKFRLRQLSFDKAQPNMVDDEYEGNESEEEERMLEEMTRGYVLDDFEFGIQSKSALPRESDSSGFSGRTWNSSSISSNPTPLSTVNEMGSFPESSPTRTKETFGPSSPPKQSLPGLPLSSQPANVPSHGASSSVSSQCVRSRRLSGQNAKQLKIETTPKFSPKSQGSEMPSMPPPPLPASAASKASTSAGQRSLSVSERPPMPSAQSSSSRFPEHGSVESLSPETSREHQTLGPEDEKSAYPAMSGSPNRTQSRVGLRKNFSSSSLRNVKNRNLSISVTTDDGSDLSPNTPASSYAHLRGEGRIPAMPALPTPIAASFLERYGEGIPTGGLYLFDNGLASPESPSSSPDPDAPIPLEPCPTEYLLRPFWLMRAFYQTIAHPRGGYISTKLFVPRDVWRVKGVKLKGVEDKIANCDLLTAALSKLAVVDTCDADAVLDEMQALESVLEQCQAALTKKLGNAEVGPVGVKDSVLVEEVAEKSQKTAPTPSKTSSFSWRRLRSKNSGFGLTNAYSMSAKDKATDGQRDGGFAIASLPMVSATNGGPTRFAKREVGMVQFSGPNAQYMSALARLFDAAQVIDQIARQVEDPGLRHADKTQVGLELSVRHAAEFFGFYICRFVLNDISALLDKFIKRGSEWVAV